MPRIEAVSLMLGRRLSMRLGSTARGPTGWTCRSTRSPRCSARSSLAVVITGRRASTFAQTFDLATERERRAEAGQPETFAEENLYPDARPCLEDQL